MDDRGGFDIFCPYGSLHLVWERGERVVWTTSRLGEVHRSISALSFQISPQPKQVSKRITPLALARVGGHFRPSGLVCDLGLACRLHIAVAVVVV